MKKMVVTHVDFPSTFYDIEQQRELVAMGAQMEHCFTTYGTGKVDFGVTLEQIRAVGADRVICSTDLGQRANVYRTRAWSSSPKTAGGRGQLRMISEKCL